jgi:hypothetical protein
MNMPVPKGPLGFGAGFGFPPSIVRAREVIISGTKDGLFVYNGTPALGNPPVFAVVSPGTTQDPYGNNLPLVGTANPVLDVGNLAAGGAHIGIDASGDLVAHAASGAEIWLLPGFPEFLIYDSTGALVESSGPSGGTDSAGNVFLAGSVTYTNIGGTHYAVQNYAGQVAFWTAPSAAGPWTIQQAIKFDLVSGYMRLGPPGVISFEVADQNTALVNRTDIPLFFLNQASPGAIAGGLNAYSNAGLARFISPNGNDWATGRLYQRMGSTYTITSGFANNGLTITLAAGEYHIRGKMLVNPSVSGGTLSFQMAGSATASGFRMSIVGTNTGQVSLSDWVGAMSTALADGTAIGAGLANRVYDVDGYINISAPGTISLQIRLSSGAAIMLQNASFLEALPI